MKYVFLITVIAFSFAGTGDSYAQTCAKGKISCEQWCNKYSVAKNGPRALPGCFNSCNKKKNGNATCVKDA
jgi:hypothetical protein